MKGDEKSMRVDCPSLIAVSIVAWAPVDILHEIIGHAGAGIPMGLTVKAVSSTHAPFNSGAWSSEFFKIDSTRAEPDPTRPRGSPP